MDPITLATLITSIANIMVTLLSRLKSSTCCGTKGVDIEFETPQVPSGK